MRMREDEEEEEGEEEAEQDRDGAFFKHRAAIAHPKPRRRKKRYRESVLNMALKRTTAPLPHCHHGRDFQPLAPPSHPAELLVRVGAECPATGDASPPWLVSHHSLSLPHHLWPRCSQRCRVAGVSCFCSTPPPRLLGAPDASPHDALGASASTGTSA